MRGVGLVPEDAILDGVEAEVEIGARVGARAQVCAEAYAALREDVVAEGDISRAPKR